jgi:predicted kinase
MVNQVVELTIILGSPASGKTTLARRLARDRSLPCLCKDDVKEALFDAVGMGDRDWSRRLSEASFAVLARLACAQLALGRSLILEGNWRSVHVPLFEPVLERARVRQIWCQAAPAEIVRRFTERRRHSGHLDAQMPLDELEKAVSLGPSFLDLPGERQVYASDDHHAYQRLIRGLEPTAL